MFGIKQENGSWSFYPEQIQGSLPVDVDKETGRIFAEALELKDGKFVHDGSKLAQAKAAILQAKTDEEAKAQAILTKISAAKTLRNKSRTLAEHGQFMDSMFDLLFGDQATTNIIELLTNGKAKG